MLVSGGGVDRGEQLVAGSVRCRVRGVGDGCHGGGLAARSSGAGIRGGVLRGVPEARLSLADAVILLATAPKSNSGYMAIDAAIADVKAGRTGPVPRELQNVHADGAGFEREQGYLYPHNFPNHWIRQQYLPDSIKDRVYYTYGDNKTEQAAKRYWDEIKK